MKCTIPEISWHNREPVLSVDIHPISTNFYKVATGGGDCHVLIWQMNITDNGAVKQEVISDLKRHQRAVNCVRWSPTGQYLASGDDDANIIIWQLKTDSIPLLEGDTEDKEVWIVYKVLRGHKEDVYDLCWSVDESKLLSGSVDNTAIVWDVTKGKLDHILCEHKGFVQGVAWDPKNEIIATLSTDRVCRIFDTTGKQVKARISKGVLQVPKEHFLYEKEVKYFHDDTFKSFFRRLQFSPDGSLLIVPSGHIEGENCKVLNATLIFTLESFNAPAAVLPLKKQSSTVIRCCPLLFELHDYGPEPLINLPYRIIFAVGTDHDVLLYDTQQMLPFARFQDIHYTRLTDLTWSSDGLLLVASSTDGFCCLITFDVNELGVPYTKNLEENVEESVLNISGCEELEKDENVDTNNKEATTIEARKRPSFLQQWTLKTPTNKKRKTENGTVDAGDCIIVEEKEEMKKEIRNGKKSVDVKKEEIVNVLIPRSKREVTDGTTKNHSAKPTAGESIDIQKEDDIKIEETVEIKNVIEIKKRSTFLEQWALKSSTKKTKPAAVLPLKKQSSTVVRCCPLLFELHDYGPEPLINLPYRIIFAVGTDHDVLLYDTQQMLPFARFQDIHYTRLTDLTWSSDGLLLVASSTDGFCCLITFDVNELGVPYTKNVEENVEESVLNISGCEELEKDENVDTNNKEATTIEARKRPSFLQQWTLKTPTNKKRKTENGTVDAGDCIIVEEKEEMKKEIRNGKKSVDVKKEEIVNVLIPRSKREVTDGTTKNHSAKPTAGESIDIQKEDDIKIEETVEIKNVIEIKKRSTFLEQWALKSSTKKTKLGEESNTKVKKDVKEAVKEDVKEVSNGKDDNADVIILDSPEKKPEELKEISEEYDDVTDEEKIKIRKEISNILCQPKQLEIQKKDHMDAKPIAVRRKPRILVEDASQKEISCTNEGNASSITQKLKVNAADVIILDSPKKKPEQFKENSEEYDDVTDEEKIKIRKEISNILCQPKQLDIQKKVHMDAKPIEVRRKPRILVENASQKEISCKNEENTATQLLTPLSKSLIRKENCNSKDHENKKTVNIENKKNPDEIKVKLMGSHSVKEDCQKVKVNASSSTQEPKVDPVDVIILDSPENNDEELKEHPEEYGDVTDEEKIKIRKEISEIWSRPTRSKNQKNDHSDAKPIAVRRKPRLDVENTVTIEKNDAGKVEALSLVKNEEEISKSFKNTIEKSKKTKEKSENAIEQQKKRPVNFLQQWVKSSTPKKIKTDTEEEEIKTKVDINVVEIGNTLQKGQELIVPKQQTPKKGNKIETKTKDKETSVVEKKITATTSKRKKAETDTNVKESPKQQTKIKVTSLTKKKTEEKKRLATPFCKIEKKSRLKSKLLGNTTFPTIDLSIEEACDSWKNVEKDDKHEDSAKKIDVTDDCTEDFTLQLEESQTSNIENCAKHGHIEEDKRRNCDISLSAEDSVVIEKNGSNKDSKSCDNNVATCSLDSGQKSCSGVKTSCSKDVDDSVATCVNSEKKDDCSKTETEKRDNLKHKLPRRVQLITISSPEGKKRAK